MQFEIRFFNSMRRHSGGKLTCLLDTTERSTILDVVQSFAIPPQDIHLVFHNGRVIGHSVDETGNTVLSDGDTVGFSGPVPFSRGYGTPVV